jgi:hypothetical protein
MVFDPQAVRDQIKSNTTQAVSHVVYGDTVSVCPKCNKIMSECTCPKEPKKM